MDATGGYVLERASSLVPPVTWQSAGLTPLQQSDRWSVLVNLASQRQFYRLREAGPPAAATVSATSPFDGETGVAVTRETIVRFSSPLAADAALTTDRFYAEFGGRRLLSRVELSSDRRAASLFYLENLPPSARVGVTLDGTGLNDANGQAFDPDGNGEPGGEFNLSFNTSSTAALPGTGVIGYVYASERNPDGGNIPLRGVTITVDGAEETLRAVTDADGFFKLEPAPAGRFFVHVDGRTAAGSQWPGGAYYPFVGKAWEAVAGRAENLAGGSGEIFLPRIQADALKAVSATEATTVTFAASMIATNPALAGVTLTVPPNALFSENGARGGRVGIAPVPPDRLPEPLPLGLNLPVVITIQTDGPQNFDQPVPVRFPNLPDPVTGELLPPGARTILWSFNHDTGRWEPQGTMTVTADGQYAESDPGVGVLQPGWHGTAPGTPTQPSPAPPPPAPGPDDEDPCAKEWYLAAFAATDCLGAIGQAIVPTSPAVGCASGVVSGAVASVRDCTIDEDGCGVTIANNFIGAVFGCGEVLAPELAPLFKGAGLFHACPLGVGNNYGSLANCRAATGTSRVRPSDRPIQLARQGLHSFDPALLDEAIENPFLAHARMGERWREFLAALYASEVWFGTSPDDDAIGAGILQAVADAIHPGSAGGTAVTTEERAYIAGLPLPPGATETDRQALVSRLERMASGQAAVSDFDTDLILTTGEAVLEMLEIYGVLGWTRVDEGYRRGLEKLTQVWQEACTAAANDPDSGTSGNSAGFAGIVRPFRYVVHNFDAGISRRGLIAPGGLLEPMVLSPDSFHGVFYLDPATLRLAVAYFYSAASGEPTAIPCASWLPGDSPLADTDGDGLPDLAELVLGTAYLDPDTDGDGLPDGLEFLNDTNPLDGIELTLGVTAMAPTPGEALEVVADNGLALVACQNGAAVFDVSDPANPTQLALVSSGFPAKAVALSGRQAAVAFEFSVRLLDLTDPSSPVVRWQRNDLGNVRGLAFGPEALFVAADDELVRLALSDGRTTAALRLPAAPDDVAVRLNTIYALSNRGLAVAISDGAILELAGQIDAPGSRGAGGRRQRLFPAGSLLYAQHTQGFYVFDLTVPDSPSIAVSHFTGQFGWRHLVPTGTGLALAAVGANSTSDGAHDVSLYDLRPGGTNAQFTATFPTPGAAWSVAIAGARGYVADGPRGLAVVNFLQPDLGSTPPTVALELPGPSPRVEGGRNVLIGTRVDDDVAVRHVEFFVNGQRVSRDDSFPFELILSVPPVSPANPNLRLRARAVDTAGNVGESPEITLDIVADATPPQILALEPPAQGVIAPNLLTEVSATFNEPLATPVNASSLILVRDGG
ncbi:MAG: Ig-like domain-containing protein, partial [Verrucomicrobia bacterium]|nr:Ig-like domain-containing protein [Verrucomicrobiota bacterium]